HFAPAPASWRRCPTWSRPPRLAPRPPPRTGWPGSAPSRACADASPRASASRPVVVDVLDFQGVLLDELAARLDLLAHQGAEHFVGLEGVFEVDLQERPLVRVERRFPQL